MKDKDFMSLESLKQSANQTILIINRSHGLSQRWIEELKKCKSEVKIINLEDSKKLKALEIIKKKRVDVNMLVIFIKDEERRVKASNYYKGIALKDYNKSTYLEKLTQEEYDLLKEVLL